MNRIFLNRFQPISIVFYIDSSRLRKVAQRKSVCARVNVLKVRLRALSDGRDVVYLILHKNNVICIVSGRCATTSCISSFATSRTSFTRHVHLLYIIYIYDI